MGAIGNAIRSVKLPSTKQVLDTYQDSRVSVKKIELNTINVRFYPKNSPFFYETKGMLHHFTSVILMTIEVPEKLGWIIQDDSISYNKLTKEEWVEARQDYPITMSMNRQLTRALKEGIKEFPDVPYWYIPASINKIPVKNIIVNFDKLKKDGTCDIETGQGCIEKKVGDVYIPQSMIDWIDSLPGEVNITTKFLYDIMDIKIIEGLLQGDDQKGGLVFFIMGGLVFSLITIMFMLYIGR